MMVVRKMGRAMMRESNTCVVNLVMEAVMLVVVVVGAGGIDIPSSSRSYRFQDHSPAGMMLPAPLVETHDSLWISP